MNVRVNIEELQSYLIEDRTIQLLAGIVHESLNRSHLFSVHFEIERLTFGSHAPSVTLLSMQDVDVATQWRLNTHDLLIPGLGALTFDAPFQAIVDIQCETDCLMLFNATLSYNQIAPGCIKYPINAEISSIRFVGRLSIQFLGDAIVLFFDRRPETIDFQLRLQLGAEEKLIDEHHVKDLLCEILWKWLDNNMLSENAVRIPLPPH
jgi:hypothetical protein